MRKAKTQQKTKTKYTHVDRGKYENTKEPVKLIRFIILKWTRNGSFGIR